MKNSILNIFTIIVRDIKLLYRSPSYFYNPIAFYIITTSLFPIAISPDPEVLSNIAGGIVWINALLAILLSLDALFQSDQEDGSLQNIILSPFPLSLIIFGKIIAHWLILGGSIILVSPLMALILHLPVKAIPALMLSLLIGTPLMILLGSIGAALTVKLPRSGILITLISLPLYIPILIFGTTAIKSAMVNLPYFYHLLLMLGFLILGITLAPITIAFCLKEINEN